MSDPIDQTQTIRHRLRDWLDLHALDQQTCLRMLDAIACEAAGMPVHCQQPQQQYQALDPDGTWALAIAAMRDFLPEHLSIIEQTFLRSEKIAIVRSQKSRRALTIDYGPSKYPTILYNSRGDASDPLVVAHEFAHALQIRACGGTFVPPVMREVCAFLGESALLSYCLDHGVIQYEAILERWRLDTRRYFGRHTRILQLALANSDAAYDYGWNYPIARFLALRISRTFSPASVWRVFEGGWSVQAILDQSDS